MNNIIKCDNCGNDIDIDEALAHSLKEKLQKEYNEKLKNERELIHSKEEELRKKEESFEVNIKAFDVKVNEAIGLKEKSIRESIKSQIEEENLKSTQAINTELKQKTEQLKDFNKALSDVERLKREKDELKDSIQLQLEKELNLRLSDEKQKIRKIEEDRNEMKMNELKKQLDDQKKLTEQMKRKQEQGSMQLQGEIQELAIEDWLTSQFPLDDIIEVGKGVRGADCIHIINTRTRSACGKIIYESKRTKSFDNKWITKFKDDMRSEGANIGVLVTETMPPDLDRMGIINSIWICSFEEFKALSLALRETILKVDEVQVVQENKGEKMGLLYDYLTGTEFKSRVEAIVEAFTKLQIDLQKERVWMTKKWAERDKEIFKVIENTMGLYGEIKGIGGSGVPDVKGLENEDELLLEE